MQQEDTAGGNTMVKWTFASVILLTTGVPHLLADSKSEEPAKEVRLAEPLALPADHYRVDPYLKAAEGLQAMGKEKAIPLLHKLASREAWPYTRTLTLCRLLFEARPKSTFRRALIGGAFFPGGTDYKDWPLEPVEIVDGVPFLIAIGYGLGGFPEPPSLYVRYCEAKCQWSTFKFKPKSKKEKQKALDKLLSSPKLKGKLDKSDRAFFDAQIK
jgi:hypothetical protein